MDGSSPRYPAGLTPREVEIARLLPHGLSTPGDRRGPRPQPADGELARDRPSWRPVDFSRRRAGVGLEDGQALRQEGRRATIPCRRLDGPGLGKWSRSPSRHGRRTTTTATTPSSTVAQTPTARRLRIARRRHVCGEITFTDCADGPRPACQARGAPSAVFCGRPVCSARACCGPSAESVSRRWSIGQWRRARPRVLASGPQRRMPRESALVGMSRQSGRANESSGNSKVSRDRVT